MVNSNLFIREIQESANRLQQIAWDIQERQYREYLEREKRKTTCSVATCGAEPHLPVPQAVKELIWEANMLLKLSELIDACMDYPGETYKRCGIKIQLMHRGEL